MPIPAIRPLSDGIKRQGELNEFIFFCLSVFLNEILINVKCDTENCFYISIEIKKQIVKLS